MKRFILILILTLSTAISSNADNILKDSSGKGFNGVYFQNNSGS